jgi:hypothetical protein
MSYFQCGADMSLIPVTGEHCLLNSPSVNTTRCATKVAKLVSVGALPVVVHKASLAHYAGMV